MEKKVQTYVPQKFDKFVVTYNGLAYWFRMKGQYLFRVSTESQFHEENAQAYKPEVFCHPISGTIVPLKQLFIKRDFFLRHPINKEGTPRLGIELLQDWVARHPNEKEDLLTYGRRPL